METLGHSSFLIRADAGCGGTLANSVYTTSISDTSESLTCQQTLDSQPRWSLPHNITCYQPPSCSSVQPQGLPTGISEVAGTRTASSTTVGCAAGFVAVTGYLGCWLDDT